MARTGIPAPATVYFHLLFSILYIMSFTEISYFSPENS